MSGSGGEALSMPAGWDRAEVDRWIAYHSAISHRMTHARTALQSALIPVTAYILIAGVECYRRYPEMMQAIAAASPPEEIGRRGRAPGTRIDAVHLWSIANIFLVGRQLLLPFGFVDPGADPVRCAVVLDFWARAARAWRADGHVQAWDAGFTVPRYEPAAVEELDARAEPLDDASRARLARLNASLTSYLFLLYFETRAGCQDSGPYETAGRRLLVRDFSAFGRSDFSWSQEVAAGLPVSNLTIAYDVGDVQVQVDDWGTTRTDPPDSLPAVERAAVCTVEAGELAPLDAGAVDELIAAIRDAQRRCYRLVASMTRPQKIDAGAYVYFTFLRPFAEMAGVADRLDWSVPRDSLDVYDALAQLDAVPLTDPDDPASPPYYSPLP